MWRPSTHGDLEAALGTVSEGPQLDFKLTVGTNPAEVAKDVAAMTIDGGVLVYGVAEQGGLADRLAPIPLQGTRERIQQIVDSAIRPVPEVEIDAIRVNPGDTDGFVVVVIPPSPLAPHQANDRYPARSDTTTRYLSEPEVARLYDQRGRLLQPPSRDQLLQRFVPAEGGLDGSSSFGGIAVERLVVAPVAPIRHPQGAWLGTPLRAAFLSAVDSVGPLVAPQFGSRTFEQLEKWTPRGTAGWKAGTAANRNEDLKQGVLVACTYSYQGHFSFVVTMSVMAEDDVHRHAFEHLWVIETMAMLSLAGHFFADIGVALVDVELGLQNLENAVSSKASGGRAFTPDLRKITDPYYQEQLRVPARTLAADPRVSTRQLFERLFASFLTPQDDIVADVAP